MGARAFVSRQNRTGRRPTEHKRMGTRSEAEVDLVQQFIQDQPGPITDKQERALARTLRRSKESVRSMIEEAKCRLGERAEFYADTHQMAVASALANGDPKSLEVAVRGSQWALENISIDGERIIDKPQPGPSGVKIVVGVKVGGANTPEAPAACVVVEGTPPGENSEP